MRNRSRGRSACNGKRDAKPQYLFVVDGETEKWYLQQMISVEKITEFHIRPELPKKKTLASLCEFVKESSKLYDKVFWIIDLDTILKEEKEKKSKSKSPLSDLKKYVSELKDVDNVFIIVNNPCLEFWYLQHYKKTGRFYPQCNDIIKEFKGTELFGYKKTERYYKKSKADIYTKLKPMLAKAINNAKSLGTFDTNQTQKGVTEMYKIFERVNIMK
ncbi:MAG: RloB family protein [Bacteroidales bacterium]